MDEVTTIPPGWSQNPSEQRRRLILAAMALVGFLVAGYLALYQLGVFTRVWEPFFGQGSYKILDSRLSRALPVPDAALGAVVYLAEALLSVSGGRMRWRTHPFVVLGNGMIAIALASTGIILLIVQPLAYHNYCTLCMLSAFISINLFGPVMEELLATLQYLVRRYTQRVVSTEVPITRTTAAIRREKRCATPVNLRFVAGAAIGLWLMAAPGILDYAGDTRAADRLVGPVIFALSIAAAWPATRGLRGLNVIAGCWLMISPIVFIAPDMALATSMGCGAILIALSVFIRPPGVETGEGWHGILSGESDR